MKYIAIYREKKIEIEADSLWWAKQEAIRRLDVPKHKQGLLSVLLAEKDDEPVEHTPDF